MVWTSGCGAIRVASRCGVYRFLASLCSYSDFTEQASETWKTIMYISHAIVFVVGMFVGGALVFRFLEWDSSVTKPTSRTVDPKSPLRKW